MGKTCKKYQKLQKNHVFENNGPQGVVCSFPVAINMYHTWLTMHIHTAFHTDNMSMFPYELVLEVLHIVMVTLQCVLVTA